jgi:hypothetical protein
MDSEGPLGSRSRIRKFLHVAFWTALFYLLAVGIGKMAERLSAG